MIKRTLCEGTGTEDELQRFLTISRHEDIVCQLFLAQGMQGEFCVVQIIFYSRISTSDEVMTHLQPQPLGF